MLFYAYMICVVNFLQLIMKPWGTDGLISPRKFSVITIHANILSKNMRDLKSSSNTYFSYLWFDDIVSNAQCIASTCRMY
jgi:hypothetical protein